MISFGMSIFITYKSLICLILSTLTYILPNIICLSTDQYESPHDIHIALGLNILIDESIIHDDIITTKLKMDWSTGIAYVKTAPLIQYICLKYL